jgi:hypothetical protein
MSYGTEQKADLKQDTKYFQTGGVHNNVLVASAKFGNSKADGTGDKNVIDIVINGEAGEIFNTREWPQEGDDKIKNQMIRLRRWVKELSGTDSFPTTFNSWEDCSQAFISVVTPYLNKVKLQIKLLYNDKGYLEMPKYDSAVRAMSDATLTISNSEQAKTVKKVVTPTTEGELNKDVTSEDF